MPSSMRCAKNFSAEAVSGDVRDTTRMTAVADGLAAKGTPASILMNNVGIGQSGIDTQDLNDTDWLRMINVRLNGTFRCTRAFAKHMLTTGKGAIVDLSFMSGTVANRPQPQAAYNVSKAAVHHLTRFLAGEWGGQVNAVAPTYIARRWSPPFL